MGVGNDHFNSTIETAGHLYLRIGRYAAAVEANRLATSADQLYTNEGLTPYGPCHNIYFGVYAACMAGMKGKAVKGSLGMRSIYKVNFTRGDAPGPEQGWNAALTTYLRFGDWDAILTDKDATLPAGAPLFPFAVVIQHYATGLALLHRQQQQHGAAGTVSVSPAAVAQANVELAALQKEAGKVSTAGGIYNYTRLVSVANLTLSAAIARATAVLVTIPAVTERKVGGVSTEGGHGQGQGRGQVLVYGNSVATSAAELNHAAVAMLQRASDEQNSWHYDEPPDWHAPVLQCLGKVLLDVGKASFV